MNLCLCRSPILKGGGGESLNADICHKRLAAADTEVSPIFRRDFFPPPQPNQVTVNFPAVSEQASDKARPNRTDGWALFAFCCYLFMCLFFLSLSPLIHPFLPLPQVPTRKQCRVTSGVICTHSQPLCVCLEWRRIVQFIIVEPILGGVSDFSMGPAKPVFEFVACSGHIKRLKIMTLYVWLNSFGACVAHSSTI